MQPDPAVLHFNILHRSKTEIHIIPIRLISKLLQVQSACILATIRHVAPSLIRKHEREVITEDRPEVFELQLLAVLGTICYLIRVNLLVDTFVPQFVSLQLVANKVQVVVRLRKSINEQQSHRDTCNQYQN